MKNIVNYIFVQYNKHLEIMPRYNTNYLSSKIKIPLARNFLYVWFLNPTFIIKTKKNETKPYHLVLRFQIEIVFENQQRNVIKTCYDYSQSRKN